MEVWVGCLGRVAVSGGDVLADNARHVAGDAACAMGLLVDIANVFGKVGSIQFVSSWEVAASANAPLET